MKDSPYFIYFRSSRAFYALELCSGQDTQQPQLLQVREGSSMERFVLGTLGHIAFLEASSSNSGVELRSWERAALAEVMVMSSFASFPQEYAANSWFMVPA